MKKGEGERVEDYRGVTLMPTLYKVYNVDISRMIKKGKRDNPTQPDWVQKENRYD